MLRFPLGRGRPLGLPEAEIHHKYSSTWEMLDRTALVQSVQPMKRMVYPNDNPFLPAVSKSLKPKSGKQTAGQ